MSDPMPHADTRALRERLRALMDGIEESQGAYLGPDVRRLIAAARALLAEAPPEPATGWRTIDSAPRDGTRFWAFEGGRDGQRYECWWQDDFAEWSGWQNDWDNDPQPTHWMPLPAPPEATTDADM